LCFVDLPIITTVVVALMGNLFLRMWCELWGTRAGATDDIQNNTLPFPDPLHQCNSTPNVTDTANAVITEDESQQQSPVNSKTKWMN
jgi:hypothetical protein